MGWANYDFSGASVIASSGRPKISPGTSGFSIRFVLTGKADFCPANLAIAQTVLLVEAARTSRRNYTNVISSLRRFLSIVGLHTFEDPPPFIPKSAHFIPIALIRNDLELFVRERNRIWLSCLDPRHAADYPRRRKPEAFGKTVRLHRFL